MAFMMMKTLKWILQRERTETEAKCVPVCAQAYIFVFLQHVSVKLTMAHTNFDMAFGIKSQISHICVETFIQRDV